MSMMVPTPKVLVNIISDHGELTIRIDPVSKDGIVSRLASQHWHHNIQGINGRLEKRGSWLGREVSQDGH
jgi:hypothetical protein